MEFTIKIDKKSPKTMLIGFITVIIIIVSFFLLKGTPGGEKSAIEEVQKLITYSLEDEYGAEFVDSITFNDLEAESTAYGENYYVVNGQVNYELSWLNTARIDKTSRSFTYYVQYRDGEWTVQDPRGDGGSRMFSY